MEILCSAEMGIQEKKVSMKLGRGELDVGNSKSEGGVAAFYVLRGFLNSLGRYHVEECPCKISFKWADLQQNEAIFFVMIVNHWWCLRHTVPGPAAAIAG